MKNSFSKKYFSKGAIFIISIFVFVVAPFLVNAASPITRITITKEAFIFDNANINANSPQTRTENFTFSYDSPQNPPVRFVTVPVTLTLTVTQGPSYHYGGRGSVTISVKSGDYKVSETGVPPGFDQDFNLCDSTTQNGFINDGQGNMHCIFANTSSKVSGGLASIKITKNTVGSPHSSDNFDFYIDPTDNNPVPITITANRNRQSTDTGTSAPYTILVSAGKYDLTEKVPTDWKLEQNASCTGAGAGASSNGQFQSAQNGIFGITVLAGQQIDCTFTDSYTPQTATIKVTKNAIGSLILNSFGYIAFGPNGYSTAFGVVTGNLSTNGSCSGNPNFPNGYCTGNSSVTVPHGSYTLQEAFVPGGWGGVPGSGQYWKINPTPACKVVAGNPPSTGTYVAYQNLRQYQIEGIELNPGDAIDCTFENESINVTGSCTSNKQCKSKSCDTTAKKCRSGAGGPCGSNNNCASGSCNLATKTCNKGGAGSACGSGSDCMSGSCNASTDTCDQGGTGSPCGSNSDCISGSCNLSTLTCNPPPSPPPSPSGSPTPTPSPCPSPSPSPSVSSSPGLSPSPGAPSPSVSSSPCIAPSPSPSPSPGQCVAGTQCTSNSQCGTGGTCQGVCDGTGSCTLDTQCGSSICDPYLKLCTRGGQCISDVNCGVAKCDKSVSASCVCSTPPPSPSPSPSCQCQVNNDCRSGQGCDRSTCKCVNIPSCLPPGSSQI